MPKWQEQNLRMSHYEEITMCTLHQPGVVANTADIKFLVICYKRHWQLYNCTLMETGLHQRHSIQIAPTFDLYLDFPVGVINA